MLLIVISKIIILTTESVIAFSCINNVVHLLEFFESRWLKVKSKTGITRK